MRMHLAGNELASLEQTSGALVTSAITLTQKCQVQVWILEHRLTTVTHTLFCILLHLNTPYQRKYYYIPSPPRRPPTLGRHVVPAPGC